MRMQKRAVVLFSGGLDSTTVLAMAQAQGFATYALTFSYGQKQSVEVRKAEALAQKMQATQWRCAHVDLSWIGGSALTTPQEVPKHDSLPAAAGVPSTYVPARNTVFLAQALAWAEALGARDIFLGVSAVDYSGYPDCRPAFVDSFERLANVATKAADSGRAWKIHAPLMHLSKAQTILAGSALNVDYSATHSCYDPQGELACAHCEACLLRARGFADAGMVDPTHYVPQRVTR